MGGKTYGKRIRNYIEGNRTPFAKFTRTGAHISKGFRRKITTPPPRNKDAARSEGESGASPTRNRLDAAKIGPHTVRERAQFILVPGKRGFFPIRKAAKEA